MAVSPAVDSWLLPLTADVDKPQFRAWALAIEALCNTVDAAGGLRERLLANRTYYVRTDGNNANTGLANNAGGAYLTLQRALNQAALIDFNGFTVTIQMGDGTYTAGGDVPRTIGQNNASNLVIAGNAGNTSAVVISTTSASCIAALQSGVRCRVQNLKLQTTTGGHGLRAEFGGFIEFSGVNFGACANHHMLAFFGGFISCVGHYTITGGTGTGSHVNCNGGYANIFGYTCTISNSPTFAAAFAACIANGVLQSFSMTWTNGGTVTAVRYGASNGGVIQTFGAGANYFPGSSAGSATSPGVYA